MECTDLMLDDWVLDTYTGKPMRVQVVSIKVGKGLEPIPITPEILEKNGFIYNELPFLQGWEQFGLTLTIGGNGFRINCGINVAMIIDFVHELQHAIRLCGIDKEIVV